jgi:ABC-type Fe3+-hydroxamate transport system substrate-binding protein
LSFYKSSVSQLNYVPKRIISLVPSQTELLFDLGLEAEIVGITKFCVHPFYAKQTKTIVGGTKNMKLNKIKELQPDIILCNKEENTLDIVEQCAQICPTHVSDIYTLEDAKRLIEVYGTIFSKRAESAHILQKLEFKLKEFQLYIQDKKTLKVAYFIWRKPWMVAAKNTFINHLLTLNKYENIYGNKERYPEIELKKIRLEGDPELIFLSSEPYPFKDEHAFEIGRFAHHAKTVFVDGELFSWYGSRLLQSFDYFKKLRSRLE